MVETGISRDCLLINTNTFVESQDCNHSVRRGWRVRVIAAAGSGALDDEWLVGFDDAGPRLRILVMVVRRRQRAVLVMPLQVRRGTVQQLVGVPQPPPVLLQPLPLVALLIPGTCRRTRK